MSLADITNDKTRIRTHTRLDAGSLGKIIIKYTSLAWDDVQQALKACEANGLPLPEQLYREGKLNSEERARCLAIEWSIPYSDLERDQISLDAVNLVELDYQKRNKILLLQIKNSVLYVGMVNPLHVNVLDEIRLLSGYEARPVMVDENILVRKHVELFGSDEETGDLDSSGIDSIVEDLRMQLDRGAAAKAGTEEQIHELSDLLDEAAVIRLVNSFLQEGIEKRASDIHIQGEQSRVQVRYRVDGVLADGPAVPKSLMKVIAARVKVMANLDLASRKTPLDGRISLKLVNKKFEVRVSILPTVRGPKIVMRIAEQGAIQIGIDKMQMGDEITKNFRSVISHPHGMFLITGPTGSGKSTTLYSALAELNTPEKNILTVENPVETQLERLSQAEIDEKAGLGFVECLRAALRQDPDVIMVGEIRDLETASIAVQASLTGHLVLSTLHTNDAPSAVTRLVDMGVQPFLVASSLIAVLAQRLVRKLCPACAVSFVPSPGELAGLGMQLAEGQTLKKPGSCRKCSNGYSGRVGIFELLNVTETIQRMILERKPDSDIKTRAIEEGMVTLKDSVCRRLSEGLTSLAEAHRTIFIGGH